MSLKASLPLTRENRRKRNNDLGFQLWSFPVNSRRFPTSDGQNTDKKEERWLGWPAASRGRGSTEAHGPGVSLGQARIC